MKKVLVIGSLNMDIVTQVRKTPKVGETVFGEGLQTFPGGKGANQAAAMGKLGTNVTMIGKVGDDAHGRELRENLTKVNVIDKTQISEAATGTAFIMVNADGDNSIVVIGGANNEIYPNEVCNEWFEDIDYVVMQNEIREETVNRVLEVAKELGKTTFYNPAPARPIEEKYISLIDYLVVNETEFEEISGIKYVDDSSLKTALDKLKVKNILLTLGSKGSKFYDGNTIIFKEAQVVKAVDTTAAGDSFIGGFICYLAQDKPIAECMEFATKVAAYTVQKQGAQSALPFLSDII